MVGFRGFQAIAFGIAFATIASTAYAAISDPCNIEPLPTVQDGVIDIAPRTLQPQRGWQRQGRDIEILVRSPKVPDKGAVRAFVCVRWQFDSNSAADIRPYQKFIPSGSTGGPVQIEKPGQLKVVATVPINLPGAPASPVKAEPDKVTGVYARNNAYPMADVRVLLFGDGDTPLFDLIRPFGVIAADVYCDMPLTDTTVDAGVGSVSQHKNWQPEDGVFEFTVKTSPKSIPTNSLVKVCFRWKLSNGDPGPFYESGPTHMLDKQSQSIKVAATVAQIPDRPRWWPSKSAGIDQRIGTYAIPIVGLVPQADARILIIDSDGSPLADVLTTVGITNLFFAAFIVFAVVMLAFIILWRVGKYRLEQMPKCNPLLRIITTRRGFASLSQFQIILWTFVVIASAAYVMALSGDLIEITTGTLVLLGISGSAGVISKAKSESDGASAPPPLDPAAAAAEAETAEDYAQKLDAAAKLASGPDKAEAEAAAAEAIAIARATKTKAAAAAAVVKATKLRAVVAEAPADQKQATTADAVAAEDDAQRKLKDAAIAEAEKARAIRLRHPAWSDLVMEEIQGRELDVTRVQMLYFTLVTAVFVLLKVITSYEIPIIPEGFLVLMGISNSVYVGSKFAAGPAPK